MENNINDLELLKYTFDKLGIKYETYSYKNQYKEDTGAIYLKVSEDNNEKLWNGYGGFYCSFNFDENGKLKDFGSWE